MPRKKKNGSRGSSPEKGVASSSGRNDDVTGWNGDSSQNSDVTVEQEKIFQHVQEMFKNKVEADVIYMVLSESDWKAGEAVEKLIALSQESEPSTSPQPLSMKSVAEALKSAETASSPIPINTGANPSSMRLDVHTRLPSNAADQPPTPEFLTMLSPKTPAGVSVEFPELFLGGQVNSAGRDSAMESAMEAFGAYANNPSVSILPSYNASKTGYPAASSFEQSLVEANLHNGPEYVPHPNHAIYYGPHAPNHGMDSGNAFSGVEQEASLFPAMADMAQNADYANAGFQYVPEVTSAGNISVGGVDSGVDSSGQQQPPPFPDLPHIALNAQGMPVRKGHRKKTLSLDPAEREALETLIEDVIIGGMDEGAIDSDSSDSESGDTPEKPSRAASDTLSPEDQRKFLAGDGGQHERREEGGGGKRGKQDKGKDGGKVYPAQLKVAVKHMKSLPPRFLRRLQTAQKQLEANAKKTGEGDGKADVAGWNNGNVSKASSNGKDPRDKMRTREQHLREKKKKIRNLLDDLDQYTDETTVIIEEKDKEVDKGEMSPGAGVTLMPVHSPAPVVVSSSVMNCADLERELLQPPMAGVDGQPLSPAELKMSPMAQRMASLAAVSNQPGVLSLATMAQDSLPADYNHAPMMLHERHSQFSVDAPEFVPKGFAPPFNQPPPPLLPPQSYGEMPPHTNVSLMSMGQSLPPGITPEQLHVLQQTSQSQAFLQQQQKAFQGHLGRVSPQAPLGRLSPQVAVSSAAGGPSIAIPAVSAHPPGPPPQLSPEQLSARNSPAPPPFLLPKVQGNPMHRPMPIPPPMVPYSGYTIPPPPNFPPQLAAGFQQQFPFRTPFVPSQQGPYWPNADKSQSFAPHGPRGHRPQGGHKDKRHSSPRLGRGRGGQRHADGQSMPSSQQSMSPETARAKVEGLLKEGRKVMVILRGAPGSGKSTIAREVQFDGVTLNTDDFFMNANGQYQYDLAKIGDAHQWNQQRAKEACEQGLNPIVIDNTNAQVWEMKYYVALADEHKYHVEIIEPNTPWKFKAKDLAKRNKHGVPLDTIVKMIDRYEKNITPASILATIHKTSNTTITHQAEDDKTVESTDNPTAPVKKTRKRKRKRKRDRKRKAGNGAKDACEEENEEKISRAESESDPEEVKVTTEEVAAPVKDEEKPQLEPAPSESDSMSERSSCVERDEQFEMDDVEGEEAAPRGVEPPPAQDVTSDEWRREQRETGLPRKISVTLADLKEALLQELAECELGSDSSDEEEPSEGKGDLQKVIEVIQDISEDKMESSPAEAGPKAGTPLEARLALLARSPCKSWSEGRKEPALERIPEGIPVDQQAPLPRRVRRRSDRKAQVVTAAGESVDPWAMEDGESEGSPEEVVSKGGPDFSPLMNSTSTMTEAADWVQLQRTDCAAEGSRVLAAFPRILSEDALCSPKKRPGWIDCSTCTEEDEGDPSCGLAFLHSCFPTVALEDLEHLLQQCRGNGQWAVNLLLDAGYEYNNSSQLPAPALDETVKTEDVRPLFDLCYARLQQQTDAKDLLDRVAEVSVDRLKCIQEFERSRTGEKASPESEMEEEEEVDVPVEMGETPRETCHLTLTREAAKQLMDIFGPMGIYSSAEELGADDMSINLDVDAARDLHRCWNETLLRKLARDDHALISADEELARRLQAEEEELQHGSPKPVRSLRQIMAEEKAMEASRRQLVEGQSSSPQRGALASQMKLQQLCAMFPSLDRDVLQDVFHAHGFCLEDTVAVLQEVHGPARPPDTRLPAPRPSESPSWPLQPAKVEASQGSINYDTFRAEALMHYELRDECFRKAQEAFQRGLKPVAAFYSQQGRLHTRKVQAANRQAAAAILQHRNADLLRHHELDLHGLHADEAVQVLKTILSRRRRECEERGSCLRPYVTVITGRGSHSRHGVARLRPAVLDYLQRNGFRFTELHPGTFRVLLKSKS